MAGGVLNWTAAGRIIPDDHVEVSMSSARVILFCLSLVTLGCQRADFDDVSLRTWRADYEVPLNKRTRAKANRVDKLGSFLSKKSREFVLSNLGKPDNEVAGVLKYELGYDLIDAYRLELHFDETNHVSDVIVTHN